nr:hypothetical protein [Klebsiella michiganensis]
MRRHCAGIDVLPTR